MDVQLMREWYESGMTVREVAQRASVSVSTANRRLRSAGTRLRQPGDKATRERYRQETMARSGYDETLLRQLSDQGWTVAEIAERIGRPAEATRRAMVRRGIPRQEPKARPERNFFWAGGYSVDKHGYVLRKCPEHPHRNKSGYVRVHRLVVEHRLGRYLQPGEVVDHRDGDTSNNDPKNLRLFDSNGEHLRATRTGRSKPAREDREALRLAAIRRAERRVASILAGSASCADPLR